MKKLILMLLILVFILPAAGKDKCNIFASLLGGYTLPWSDGNGDYIVMGIIAAAVAFCLVKYTTITAMALAALLLATSYVGYRKKWEYYYAFLIAACALILAAGILTNSPIIMKVLFAGTMVVILVLSLIMDRKHKKIKILLWPENYNDALYKATERSRYGKRI